MSAIENGRALVRNGTELVAYPSASNTITMSSITSIGNNAFSGSSELIGVGFTIVTSIGDNAFKNCNNLQNVFFPLATNIRDGAFNNCSKLQNIDFPQVTTIGSQAFWGCSGLENLNIPKVTSIGSNAFSYTGTTPLTITMGSTAPTLGYNMFQYIYEGFFTPGTKTITVKIPAGATGYTPFAGYSTTVNSGIIANWVNGFRGGGWNGTTWSFNGVSATGSGPENINQNITIIFMPTLTSSLSWSSANLTAGAVHYYEVLMGSISYYEISWRDTDNGSSFVTSPVADIIVGIRKVGEIGYLIPVSDDGNYGANVHRLNRTSAPQFEPNSYYIIEVRGYSASSSGNYQIRFY